MAGIDTSTLYNYTYGNYNFGTSGTSSSYFDPTSAANTAKQQAQELLNSLKGNQTEVKSLKAETSKYLDTYILNMKTMDQSANALRNGGIDKLLYDTEGNVTDETVGKTVDAVQKMVDNYNSTLKHLNDNADRGPGTVKQLGRMVTDPAPAKSMEMVGITVNKDGTLALDKEVMTKALKDENPLQVNLFKDIIGGYGGIADGVHLDAMFGQNMQAKDLIQNDLANIQSSQNAANPFKEMYQSMKGSAYLLNNQAVTGMLMNMLV